MLIVSNRVKRLDVGKATGRRCRSTAGMGFKSVIQDGKPCSARLNYLAAAGRTALLSTRFGLTHTVRDKTTTGAAVPRVGHVWNTPLYTSLSD